MNDCSWKKKIFFPLGLTVGCIGSFVLFCFFKKKAPKAPREPRGGLQLRYMKVYEDR